MEDNRSHFDSFELQITPIAQGFLRETAKWAMFLSILGFIVIGFIIISGLGMLAAGSAMNGSTAGMGMFALISPTIIGGIYIVMAILYFFPVYYLYKFSSNIKQAFATNNIDILTGAFENLKSHYKFIGILTIVMIVGWIVGVIALVSVIGSAASGM